MTAEREKLRVKGTERAMRGLSANQRVIGGSECKERAKRAKEDRGVRAKTVQEVSENEETAAREMSGQ